MGVLLVGINEIIFLLKKNLCVQLYASNIIILFVNIIIASHLSNIMLYFKFYLIFNI